MKNYFFIAFFLFLLKEGNSQAIEWPVDKDDEKRVKFFSQKLGCSNKTGSPDTFYIGVFYIDTLLNRRDRSTEKLTVTTYPDTSAVIKVSFDTPLGSRTGTVEILAYVYGEIDSTGFLKMPTREEVHTYSIRLRAPLLSNCEFGFIVRRYEQLGCSGKTCLYVIDRLISGDPRKYQELDAFIYRFIDTHPIEFYEIDEDGRTVKLE